MPDEDYARLEGEGAALAARIHDHCAEEGRDVVVGSSPGRNAPRFTVHDRARPRVPLVTWSPTWNGWLEKAEEACRKAGLLPDTKEAEVPRPSNEEVERSNRLRERIAPLARAVGTRALCERAVAVMEERGIERFGEGAKSEPAYLAEIQLTRFLNEGAAMLDKNLSKWEAVIEELESDGDEDAADDVEAADGVVAGIPVEALAAAREEAEQAQREARELREQLDRARSDAAEAADVAESERVSRAAAEDEAARMREDLRERETALAVPSPGSIVERDVEGARPDGVRIDGMEDFERVFGGVLRVALPDQADVIADEVRRRYADQLLRSLDRNDEGLDHEQVMRRLDRIAGLDRAEA